MNTPQENAEQATPNASVATLLTHCIAEARWMLAFWVVCFAWVIGYCGLFGYESDNAEPTIVLGMPAWVVWGVIVPWFVAVAASSWFALVKIANDPLAEIGVSAAAIQADRSIDTNE